MTRLIKDVLEEIEERHFASYAVKSSLSRGRKYPEPPPEFRTDFQRDRDRIVHATAFRRLEYKTQVFLNHEGDHYRTRLTHTIEVSQIARTIARALGLNETLTEALALAHDIGHTAFGHAGEDELDILMKHHGGFDHNVHGFRIVSFLEKRYPDFPGLNLTWEVREGFLKHDKSHAKIRILDPDFKKRYPSLSLEAQVVNFADEIAYDSHDIDDGFRAGLISPDDLDDIPLWRSFGKKIRALSDPHQSMAMGIRMLMNEFVGDLIEHSVRLLEKKGPKNCDDVRKCHENLIGFSTEIENNRYRLKEFLTDNVYRHKKVMRKITSARRMISELFAAFIKNPKKLPGHVWPGKDLHQTACNYIAGMTDRFARKEYSRCCR